MWFQHTFYPLPANSFNSYALKRRIYFTDSKLDGLDDALIQQTQMESFLPISGCVDMKSGIWIATWFAGLLLLFWRLILCDTVVFWNSAIIQDRTRTPGFESWRPNDWATEVSSMAQWSLSKQFLYFIKKSTKVGQSPFARKFQDNGHATLEHQNKAYLFLTHLSWWCHLFIDPTNLT